MRPQTAEVESTLSYAHRVGGDVRVVLHLLHGDLAASQPEVRLRSRKRVIVVPAQATAEGEDTVLRFEADQAELGSRVWTLTLLRGTDHDPVRVQARLLTTPSRPVALLPGAAPETRMAPPRPGAARTVGRQSPLIRVAKRLPSPVQDVLRRGRAAARRRSE